MFENIVETMSYDTLSRELIILNYVNYNNDVNTVSSESNTYIINHIFKKNVIPCSCEYDFKINIIKWQLH